MGFFTIGKSRKPAATRPVDDELDARSEAAAIELRHSASNAEQLINALLEARKPHPKVRPS